MKHSFFSLPIWLLLISALANIASYSVPKKLFWRNSLSADITQSNKVIEGFAKSAGVTYLDLSQVFFGDSSTLDSSLFIDTLHINDTAYGQINNELAKLLPTLSESQ